MAREPLISMTVNLEKRIKKILQVMEDLGYTEKGTAIDKTVRDEIAVKGGWAESTVRIYLNQIEKAGYLSSDGKRPKTWYLLYSMPTIKRKFSVISEKIENRDVLIHEMRKEARKWFESLLLLSRSRNDDGGLPVERDEIQRIIQEAFPEKDIHDNSLDSKQAPTTETWTHDHNSQKLTEFSSLPPKQDTETKGKIGTEDTELSITCWVCKHPIIQDKQPFTYEEGPPCHVKCLKETTKTSSEKKGFF